MMPSENIPIRRPLCGTKKSPMNFAGRFVCTVGAMLICLAPCARAKNPPVTTRKTASHSSISAKQLETLARTLKEHNSHWAYARLSDIAQQKSAGVMGARAALALGYFDYDQGNYSQAERWLNRAKDDTLLGDYALYWKAETDLALNHNADALAELQQIRSEYPNSIMTDQVLHALAAAALAANQPADALAALDAYPQTRNAAPLLFLHGELNEQASKPLDAAADYQTVYLRFPLSEQATEAVTKLNFLRSSPGLQIPAVPLDRRLDRAAVLFNARSWQDARNAYSEMLPELSGVDQQRAEVRILECGVHLGAGPSDLTALKIDDSDVDAERDFALADYYRDQQSEPQMTSSVEAAVARAPKSTWAESALFLAGNYYWVQLQRDQASSYYARVGQLFPDSADADAAMWRVAWTTVMKRDPEAAKMLEDHLRRFPTSIFTPDTLYWLGRLAEGAGVPQLARTYYAEVANRFPQTYFGSLGSTRLKALGPGSKEISNVLTAIPPLPAAPDLTDPVSPTHADHQDRADALRSIAFDESAELELRAGYAATGEPHLLLEAAQEAVVAQHYGAGIVIIRQVYPQLESRPFVGVPLPVWQAAYALPFENLIRRWSAHSGVDPMLVAGLIHQESAFDPKARSGSDAIGLMQLIAPTARRLARQVRVRYSTARLTEPDYNIRLGTTYLQALRAQFGTVEEAVAAYNAGEDRVVAWTAGQDYREPAEFVDSIPFTQTREYVEIVLRNAALYRRLYGAKDEPRTTRARIGR